MSAHIQNNPNQSEYQENSRNNEKNLKEPVLKSMLIEINILSFQQLFHQQPKKLFHFILDLSLGAFQFRSLYIKLIDAASSFSITQFFNHLN